MSRMVCRFVILSHTGHGQPHFDLMLEDGPALATWQLATMPSGLPPGGVVSARKLPDHRSEYLSYEGPVSCGRGSVQRVECGSFDLLRREEGCWEVLLDGTGVQGRFDLRRTGPAAEDWELRRPREAGSPR